MKIASVIIGIMLIACAWAYSVEIAFYVGNPNVDGWYSVEGVLADVETIKNETSSFFSSMSDFDDDQLDELAAWAEARTDDGKLDIIWLNGCVPSTLYQFPNVEPDDSVIENWLDGGNMIINVGDWFAYCSYEGGARQTDNGSAGAANILDLSAGIIYSADNTTMTTTDAGRTYVPSIGDSCISYRPISVAEVVDPWEVAAVFASITGDEDANGDPVVIHNTETDGYVAFINQSAGSGPPGWLEDRGLTCAEFINNWVGEVIGVAPIEAAAKLSSTWGDIKSR
jgi:hypothetical protein